MNIGLDGLPLTSPKTGVGHYTFELACALADIESASHFEFVYPSTYPEMDVSGNATRPKLPTNLKLQRVNVGVLARHWWSAGLPHYIKTSNLQLFHGTNYEIPLWRPCATVLTIHDLSPLIHPETHHRRSAWRARRRMPVMVRAADAIITPTETVRREVCEHLRVNPEKVFAIPEAARDCFRPLEFHETAEVRARLGISDEFLLTVGTVEPRKNLSVVVSAFEEVLRARPESKIQLIIVGGRGWLSDPLFTAVERSPARHRIIFTGYLHDEDLRSLYASCRGFIYPSIYEGFGLPPLEAMACGAPVIASRTATLVETTAHAALLFDPHSVTELVHKIFELIGTGNARHQLSAIGQRRAAEFSWERTARMTWDVYAIALEKRRTGRE
ncbi:MAG: glycosyltransferase family 4 protein [Pyrinomonadaceae bacterium]